MVNDGGPDLLVDVLEAGRGIAPVGPHFEGDGNNGEVCEPFERGLGAANDDENIAVRIVRNIAEWQRGGERHVCQVETGNGQGRRQIQVRQRQRGQPRGHACERSRKVGHAPRLQRRKDATDGVPRRLPVCPAIELGVSGVDQGAEFDCTVEVVSHEEEGLRVSGEAWTFLCRVVAVDGLEEAFRLRRRGIG